jgi:ElaB/YqjD/DUF883 family membrane-anchored ribosome-binding protein
MKNLLEKIPVVKNRQLFENNVIQKYEELLAAHKSAGPEEKAEIIEKLKKDISAHKKQLHKTYAHAALTALIIEQCPHLYLGNVPSLKIRAITAGVIIAILYCELVQVGMDYLLYRGINKLDNFVLAQLIK